MAVNTLGASLAPLLFGVVLLPRLGSLWALVLASFGDPLPWLTGRRSYWMPALVFWLGWPSCYCSTRPI